MKTPKAIGGFLLFLGCLSFSSAAEARWRWSKTARQKDISWTIKKLRNSSSKEGEMSRAALKKGGLAYGALIRHKVFQEAYPNSLRGVGAIASHQEILQSLAQRLNLPVIEINEALNLRGMGSMNTYSQIGNSNLGFRHATELTNFVEKWWGSRLGPGVEANLRREIQMYESARGLTGIHGTQVHGIAMKDGAIGLVTSHFERAGKATKAELEELGQIALSQGKIALDLVPENVIKTADGVLHPVDIYFHDPNLRVNELQYCMAERTECMNYSFSHIAARLRAEY